MNKILCCFHPIMDNEETTEIMNYDQLKQNFNTKKIQIENTKTYIYLHELCNNIKELFNTHNDVDEPERIELETIHTIIDSVVDEMKENILSMTNIYDNEISIECPIEIKELQIKVNDDIIQTHTETYGISSEYDDYINIEIDLDFNYLDIQ